MGRDLIFGPRPDVANGLIDIAPHLLQGYIATGAAILAFETKRQAGVHEFQEVNVECRVGLHPGQLVKKTDAAGSGLEKPAQHAVLRPQVTLASWQVLHDVVSGCAQGVFGRDDLLW